MDPRASGYVTEIGYTHGYYQELAPGLLSLAALNAGAVTRTAEPLRYLELGFGQGLSLAIHAAACPGEYWGVDIIPAHVDNAQAMAEASGASLRALQDSFEELASRRNLPEFDIIVAHGVWSWVSDANRRAIVDIVRRKLADGGMLYLSYNCTPGSSSVIPLRHLMTMHANLGGSGERGILERIDGALDFTQRVADTGMGYFKANPGALARLNGIKAQDRAGVAHEFFNADWEPMPFARTAGLLAPADVSFAASATLLHHLDGISLPPAASKLLGEIDHPILRESVRDYLINASFRRDIFIKGGKPMPASERQARYLKQGFVLAHGAETFPIQRGGTQAVFTVNAAEITLKEEFYRPVVDVLAEGNHAPMTLDELSSHPRLEGQTLPSLITALFILCAARIVRPAQDFEVIRQARPRCNALNAWLIERPPAAGEIAWLASPVSGIGVPASRNEVLFLQALRRGETRPEIWARSVTEDFYSGTVISGPEAKPGREEKLSELTDEAKAFAAARLPILRALEVV